nr:neocarzinostatin apoprotein domain-containing protein [Nocardioides sp. InS609-2]
MVESITREAGPIWGTAAVRGSGYAANVQIEVSQCPASAPGASVDALDCLYDTTGIFRSDATGSFVGEMQVAFKFQRSDGELIDCAASPSNCALAVPFPNGYGVRMSRVLFSTVLRP